jgi:hypothetical protein
MRHSMESILEVEYLRKYKSIFLTALAHEPGGPGVSFDKKKIQR